MDDGLHRFFISLKQSAKNRKKMRYYEMMKRNMKE